MKKVTDESRQRLLELVREETGAEGVLVITTDSFLPCPDSLSGIKCVHPHSVELAVDGISPLPAIEVICTVAGISMRDMAQMLIDNDVEEDSN